MHLRQTQAHRAGRPDAPAVSWRADGRDQPPTSTSTSTPTSTPTSAAAAAGRAWRPRSAVSAAAVSVASTAPRRRPRPRSGAVDAGTAALYRASNSIAGLVSAADAGLVATALQPPRPGRGRARPVSWGGPPPARQRPPPAPPAAGGGGGDTGRPRSYSSRPSVDSIHPPPRRHRRSKSAPMARSPRALMSKPVWDNRFHVAKTLERPGQAPRRYKTLQPRKERLPSKQHSPSSVYNSKPFLLPPDPYAPKRPCPPPQPRPLPRSLLLASTGIPSHLSSLVSSRRSSQEASQRRKDSSWDSMRRQLLPMEEFLAQLGAGMDEEEEDENTILAPGAPLGGFLSNLLVFGEPLPEHLDGVEAKTQMLAGVVTAVTAPDDGAGAPPLNKQDMLGLVLRLRADAPPSGGGSSKRRQEGQDGQPPAADSPSKEPPPLDDSALGSGETAAAVPETLLEFYDGQWVRDASAARQLRLLRSTFLHHPQELLDLLQAAHHVLCFSPAPQTFRMATSKLSGNRFKRFKPCSDTGEYHVHASFSPRTWLISLTDQTSQRIVADELFAGDIREIRVGAAAAHFPGFEGLALDESDLCFVVVYGSGFVAKQLGFVASNPLDFLVWTVAAFQYGSRFSKQVRRDTLAKQWLERKWHSYSEDGSSVSLDRVAVMLKEHHWFSAKNSKDRLSVLCDRVLAACSTLADLVPAVPSHLQKPEFFMLYDVLHEEDILGILPEFVMGQDGKLSAEEYKEFMTVHQHEDEATLPDFDVFLRRQGVSDSDSFTASNLVTFLFSHENRLAVGRRGRTVDDMTQPLSDYWIASSHNTYLLGDQLRSESSAEAYSQCLRQGCRCLELDCWDGPNGEPQITHGRTLCTKVPLGEVLLAIRHHAFLESSFPLILSIENHCSLEQQEVMADMFVGVLGSLLLTEPLDDQQTLPSPAALQNKILLKGKAGVSERDEDSIDALSMDMDEGSLAPEDELLKSLRSELATASLPEADEEGGAAGAEVLARQLSRMAREKTKIHPKLAKLIVYCKGVKFPGVPVCEQGYYAFNEMSSIKENKFLHAMADPAGAEALRRTANEQGTLLRIYPKNTRYSSSNFDPTPMWAAGMQMVALNYQTPGRPLWLNSGLFHHNGQTGYALKPACLKDPNFDASSEDSQTTPVLLRLRVIAGQHFERERKDCKPKLEVRVSGLPQDDQVFWTAPASGGFTPVWDASFEIPVLVPELAMISFVVYHGKQVIGQRAYRVGAVRPGFRSIHLHDVHGDAHQLTCLLVHLERATVPPPADRG